MANATTKTVEAPTEKVAVEREGVPVISPKSVKLDHATDTRKFWIVRLPEGFEWRDVMDIECWRKVQANPGTAMARHHRVYLIAHDESWAAECVVTGTTGTALSLSAPGGKINMESRVQALFSDGTYRVEWKGSGYVVVRISDGHVMTLPVQSVAVAEKELRLLYPRPAA